MTLTQRARSYWTNCSKVTLDLLYPPKCSLCGQFGDSNPCIQCVGEMTISEPAIAYNNAEELAFQGSVYRYPGRAGQAVRLLKYERRTGLAEFMAKSVRDTAEAEVLEYDIAIPIPIHWLRLVSRGFNQADLLASSLPKREFGLRRVRATKPQAGLNTAERLTNLDGAFEVVTDVKGKVILLIDDVVTSGQTAKECAKALRAAGASEVGILAFCGDVY